MVAVLAVTGLTATFMFTLVMPIQSRLPELLNASRDDTAWVVTVTLLSSTIMTPIAGRLGDMYGKRTMILVLLATLVVGSVVAALSTGLFGVILGRALQGTAMGVVPLGMSIVRDELEPHRVNTSIALISGTTGVGSSIGLPVSALIVERLEWHALFWVAGAAGLIMFALVWFFVPNGGERKPARFDVVGVIGLAIGLVGILLGVSRGNVWGWLSMETLLCFGGGIAVLLLWGWYELRVKDPLLNLRLAARPAVLLTNLSAVALGYTLFTANVAFPQLVEMPRSELGAGLGTPLFLGMLVIIPSGIMNLLMSPIAGRLADRVGPRALHLIGSSILLVSFTWALATSTEVWHVLVANVLIGLGIGIGFAAQPMLIMRAVPRQETAASTGLNTLFRSFGTSTAGAVVGAVLASSTVDVEGTAVPTLESFQISYVVAGACAVLSIIIGICIPKHRGPATQVSLPTTDSLPGASTNP